MRNTPAKPPRVIFTRLGAARASISSPGFPAGRADRTTRMAAVAAVLINSAQETQPLTVPTGPGSRVIYDRFPPQ